MRKDGGFIVFDKDNSNDARKRILVVPGEEIGDDSFRPGMGTYMKDGKIFASQLGLVNERAGYINVNPISSKYLPRSGDSVIGIVKDVGPSSWIVDINSPYPALLHINEVPWKVDFGDTASYLTVGNVVLVKIIHVDETKRVQLSMKEHGLRILNGGQLVRISHSKVPRVIGKNGSMISMLKQSTDSRMFVGQNGNIWIDGEIENINLVRRAIEIIDNKTHVSGLTDEIRVFLSENVKTGTVKSTENTSIGGKPMKDTPGLEEPGEDEPDVDENSIEVSK